MTRSMNSKICCERCGHQTTVETHFERWMRGHSGLDSSMGVVRFDADILLHKYKDVSDSFGDRQIQALMFVEVKTFGAMPSKCQWDTLGFFDQVLRNRRDNMYSKLSARNATGVLAITRAWSSMLGRDVDVRMFGGHLLRFEKNGPDDSQWIKWGSLCHGKGYEELDITEEDLVNLLSFNANPDNPTAKLDIRRRSRGAPQRQYGVFEDISGF